MALAWWSTSITLIFMLMGLYAYHVTGLIAAALGVSTVLLLGQGVCIFEIFGRGIFCEELQLELYHSPRWWRMLICFQWPLLTPVMLGGKVPDKTNMP